MHRTFSVTGALVAGDAVDAVVTAIEVTVGAIGAAAIGTASPKDVKLGVASEWFSGNSHDIFFAILGLVGDRPLS